jgi:alpha-mannosidase
MIHQQRWTAEKIRQRLALIAPLVHRRQTSLPPFRYRALAGPTDAAAAAAIHDNAAGWPIIEPYSYWGNWMTDYVLRTEFNVPTGWDPAAPVALYLPVGEAGDFSHPEALAYVDGAAYATVDRHHQEIALPPEWRDGQPHALALHGWTGLGDLMQGNPFTKLFMRPCAVVQIDQPARDFIAAARTALGVATALDADEPARGLLLNGLDAAFKLLDTREPFGDAFYDSLPAAHEALREAVAQAGPPLDVHLYAAGHAHIDVAWLWTLGQTRRKAERTFHTVIRLMEQFPDYTFTQSQPQLYDFIRQDQPALLESIRARVADGRWEPIGGMWVEADCNLSGGESLARQFLLGRTFFREQFGPDAESPILWLPDVFGYAWNLPQLIKEAGLEYFFTIKIGWSQYNRMPYDSFWWQGLDGTRVLTHFSPAKDAGEQYVSTYNAMIGPATPLATWTNFQQKEQSQDLLMAYGYGDGGGGPTREMLENIREMAAYPRPGHRLLPRPGGPQRRPAAGLERRAVSGVSPRHLHHPRPQQARQPPQRVPAAQRRLPGRLCRPDGRAGRRHPQGRAGPRLAACLPQPVPRHHPRHQHRPRLCRVAGAVCRGEGAGRGGHRRRPVGRRRGAGRGGPGGQRQ